MHVAWLVFVVLAAFAFWGMRPLWEPDEGRYAEAAREMLVLGDPLVPRLQGEAHLTKPPLTYWLIAAGLWATGVSAEQPVGNAWGARFYVSVAFLLTILCVWRLGRCWGWSEREARLSSVIYATSLLPFACGNIISTDVLLCAFETLGVLCAWKAWSGGRREAAWRWGFWISFGLAFLTKGPPALLPWLALAAYSGLRRQRPPGRVFSWGGLFAFLVVALWWFVILGIREPETVRYFLEEEVLNRVFTDEHERGRAFWFYWVVTPVAVVPWMFLWPAFFAGLRRRWQRTRDVAGEGAGVINRLRSLSPTALFSLLWFVLPMCVFQLSNSKMYLYIVPLMVPLALWFGRVYFHVFPQGLPRDKWMRGLFYFVGCMWVGGMLGFRMLPDEAPTGRSFKVLGEAIRETPPAPGAPVYLYAEEAHSLSFYSGRVMTVLDGSEAGTGDLMRGMEEEASERRVMLVTDEDGIEDLEEKEVDTRLVAKQGNVRYLEVLPQGD